jgi:hypothetical protein
MKATRALPFVVLGAVGIGGVALGGRWTEPAAPAPAPAPPAPAEPAPPAPAPPPAAPAAPAPPEPAAPDSPRTVVADPTTAARLVGTHPFSLQWISWGSYGEATFTDDDGLLRVSARQDAKRGSDFAALDGVVTHVGDKRFTFEGVIETRVSHIARGKTCRREGTFHFRASGKRRYFRLVEKHNPCDGTPRLVDYVDIFWTHPL